MPRNTNSLGIPNPYGVGQGIFDSTPATHYYLMQKEQEKAKDLALDKSINDLATNITPKGMRNIDIVGANGNDGFLAKKNEWLKFGIDNRKAIKDMSDGGIAYAKFNEGYNKLLGDIERSKEAANNTANFFTITKGNKNYFTPESMADADLQQKSIYDPLYKPLDFNKLTQKQKFDLSKFEQDIKKGFKLSEGQPTITQSPQDPYTNIVTTPLSYNNENKLRMGGLAASLYQSDPDFKYYVNTDLSKELQPTVDSFGRVEESKRWKELNNIFKENTGTDMRISPDNMSDAAAALGFEIASRKNEDVKTQPNFKARSDENLKRQKEMAAISDANAMKHIAFAHSLKDKDNSPEKINNVMDNIDEVSSQIKMHDPTVKSVEIKKSLFGGMLGLDNKRIIQVNKYDEKGKLKSYTINFDPSKPKETSDAIIQAYKRHHVVTDADIKKFNETPKVTLSKSDRVNVKPIKGKKLY